MLFYYGILYLAPALVLSSITMIATWRRGQWWLLDFLVIPLPGALWMLLMNEGFRPKSFSNLVELVALAATLLVLFVIRAWIGARIPRVVSSLLLMVAGLTSAAAIFYLVPLIPD